MGGIPVGSGLTNAPIAVHGAATVNLRQGEFINLHIEQRSNNNQRLESFGPVATWITVTYLRPLN
jgi:hypothetical protein